MAGVRTVNDLGKLEFMRAPETGDEREMLIGFLATQRSLVHWKLWDARDEDLFAVATPTGLTPRGVLNHLTNVERWWWREVFDGQEALEFDWTDADPDGELHIGPDKPLARLLAEYADECARCDTNRARISTAADAPHAAAICCRCRAASRIDDGAAV